MRTLLAVVLVTCLSYCTDGTRPHSSATAAAPGDGSAGDPTDNDGDATGDGVDTGGGDSDPSGSPDSCTPCGLYECCTADQVCYGYGACRPACPSDETACG